MCRTTSRTSSTAGKFRAGARSARAWPSRSRLILFDKRGTGLSDFGGHFPALETRMDDVRAVLDAAGSTSAVVFGSHDGCSMSALFAATYPERTRALVLFHPMAHDPEGQTEQTQRSWRNSAKAGERRSGATSSSRRPRLRWPVIRKERELFANWLRVGASPAVAYSLNRAWSETDLREVLPAVRVPTLVLYRAAWWRSMPAR